MSGFGHNLVYVHKTSTRCTVRSWHVRSDSQWLWWILRVDINENWSEEKTLRAWRPEVGRAPKTHRAFWDNVFMVWWCYLNCLNLIRFSRREANLLAKATSIHQAWIYHLVCIVSHDRSGRSHCDWMSLFHVAACRHSVFIYFASVVKHVFALSPQNLKSFHLTSIYLKVFMRTHTRERHLPLCGVTSHSSFTSINFIRFVQISQS